MKNRNKREVKLVTACGCTRLVKINEDTADTLKFIRVPFASILGGRTERIFLASNVPDVFYEETDYDRERERGGSSE